jgi:hypothetical protein
VATAASPFATQRGQIGREKSSLPLIKLIVKSECHAAKRSEIDSSVVTLLTMLTHQPKISRLLFDQRENSSVGSGKKRNELFWPTRKNAPYVDVILRGPGYFEPPWGIHLREGEIKSAVVCYSFGRSQRSTSAVLARLLALY